MNKNNDIIVQNIKVLNDKDIKIIHNNDGEDYIFSALTVEGGGVFKKGIVLGMQDKMISGLLLYDNENFYGYSDKYGLCLLSNHQEYDELMLPEHIFEGDRIQPTYKNDFKNDNDNINKRQKKLNIDINIKDIGNFYIKIPDNYDKLDFILIFDINYIYDMGSIISNVILSIINESSKNIIINIVNDNCYYSNNFNNNIKENSITNINLSIINDSYFLLNMENYKKK